MPSQASTLEVTLQTLNKIKSFEKLPTGWHYGQGVPPSEVTIARARILVIDAFLTGTIETNAFSGVDGEIQVTMYHGISYLEFTIAPNGTVTAVYEEGGIEKDYAENLPFDQALAKLKEYSNRIWASSGLSITPISTAEQENLKALPSKTPATEAASLSSKKTVPLPPAPVYAGTSTGSILTSLASLQFFGTFPKDSLTLAT
jgi:hypothetical protein